jgi:hypothetical protein
MWRQIGSCESEESRIQERKKNGGELDIRWWQRIPSSVLYSVYTIFIDF